MDLLHSGAVMYFMVHAAIFCGHVGFAVKMLVAIRYSVLAARNGYTRNAVV